ncbi:MAG: MotA/TolQ/ExbB proton channel family protein [Thermodesulfobacteriota bacterium]|nr:MotA/TolQ/ExbB proton channel family protein [Thermodesulfobacteriota bacterium]
MISTFQDHIYRIEDYLAAGGMVMVPLVVVSALMWTLIINRVFFFRSLYRKNMSRKAASEYVKAGEFPDAQKYRGAIALLVTGFLQRRSGQTRLDRFILDETVIVIVSSLDRYLALISVFAVLAPLLGLLGTVTGMIATFDIISIFGTGNAKAMAGGISEALITTQTGLLLAIPGLYMSNFLNRRAENLKRRISSVGIYLRRYV